MGAHGKHIILEASKLLNHFPKALRRIDMEIDALVSQVSAIASARTRSSALANAGAEPILPPINVKLSKCPA